MNFHCLNLLEKLDLTGTKTGGIRYDDNGEIHGPSGNGVGRPGIQFADVTGKGTADYLMIEPNGRTTMDFNGGPITNANTCNRYFQSHGVIATGAGNDYEVLYGDLNGDSRAECTFLGARSTESSANTNGRQCH